MITKKNSLCLLCLCFWILFVSVCATWASSPSEIKKAFPFLELNNSLFISAEHPSQIKIIRSQYNDKPKGVGISFKLDPDKRYFVSVVGQIEIIRPLLGIRIVGTPDRIIAAPNGEIFFNVFNTPQVTLFLNIDPKIKYQLNSIQFIECPQCIDQKELIQLIHKEKPQLETHLNRDPLIAAQTILDWTANVTPFALSKPFHDKTENINRMSAQEIYNLFNMKQSGVYCGGASLFLNKVLTLFEVDSFILDFGDNRNLMTHTTVVIASRSSEYWKYYIFDPTFNITFQNPNNDYFITFSEILELPLTNIKNKITTNQQSLHKRKFIGAKEDAKLCTTIEEITPSYISCKISNYTLRRFFHLMNPTYVKNGYSKNLPGFFQLLHNRVFSVGGVSKTESKDRFIEILKTHKIPLGNSS
jgi:hypothetical protein